MSDTPTVVDDPVLALAQSLRWLTQLPDLGAADAEPIPLVDAAHVLRLCEQIARHAEATADAMRQLLVDVMDDDAVETRHGWLVREALPPSVKRDNKGAHERAKSVIVQRHGVDIATGELRRDWQAIIDRTLIDVFDSFSVGAPKAGIKRLGLDPADYIEETARGYTVKIVDDVPVKG